MDERYTGICPQVNIGTSGGPKISLIPMEGIRANLGVYGVSILF
jgi:hypothetical protein